ncbi:MAG: hypothetical protein CMP59_01705 [Flavobacteriales bacterium]|nr:hypothetical protein [Flavobacteriales bacterium]|tara:strand:+ start:1562 stop:1924 length:363 start_codon:yes stop_codon:yes gene_type:complete
MKTITLILLIGISSFQFKSECADAYSAAEKARDLAKKSYKSDSWKDSKSLLKEAMESANDAKSFASDCVCQNANSAANDAYKYAKQGYDTDSMNDTKNFAKKAMKSADDVMSLIDDCTVR